MFTVINKWTYALYLLFILPLSANDNTDLFALSLSDLRDVKVAIASKNTESIRETASSVTVFNYHDISELGINNWTDLLSQVPGFYNMMNAVEGNQSHIIIRGHAQKYANTLLVLLNGHRINDDYTGGINYLIRYMDLADVQRVEIIRGPGSAIYGSNAYSGVINIITQSENRVAFSVGEFNAKKLLASYTHKLENWQLGATFSHYQDDGDLFTDVFDRNRLQNTTKDPHDATQLRVYLENEQTQLFGQYIGSERQDYYLFRRLRDNVSEINQRHMLLGLNHNFYNTYTASLDFSGSYQQGKRKSLTALEPKGETPFENVDFLFGENFTYRSANLALDGKYQWGSSVLLNAGLSYVSSQVPEGFLQSNFDFYGDFEQLPDVITFDGDDQRTVLDKKRIITSLYLQAKWQLNDSFNLTTGLRFDGYNDVDNVVMPRIGLIYQVDNQQTIKLLYGEGYRAPSLGDLYDEESGLTIGSKSLKASEIRTTELAYFLSLSHFEISSTLFYNKQSNLIGFTPDASDKQVLANIANNEAQGVDFTWLWQPINNIRVKGSVTHLWKNQTTRGEYIGLPTSETIAPNTYMNYSIDYKKKAWSFNLNGTWRSSVKVLIDEDDLWLVNSHVQWQLTYQSTLKLTVKNLTDINYDTSSYSILGTNNQNQSVQEYPARGRQTMLTYDYQF
jgi:outer membrane receptor for ferrienterochelin and colicins